MVVIRFWLVLALAALGGAMVMQAPAYAYDSDAALDNTGHLCTRHVARSERRYGIPKHLLAAVAATETGRWHNRLGVFIPWPWTLNVEGKPYFFHTKREAVAALAAFQAQGKKSIDVGCMQVNLKHHPDAFANINQALEPSYNIDYAARFLRGHYDAQGQWKTAVGRYHSHTPQYANRYISSVYSKWYGLAGRATGATTATATAANTKTAMQPRKRYTTFVSVGGQEAIFTREGEQAKKSASTKPGTQKSVSLSNGTQSRVVKVSGATEGVNGNLALIRPTHASGKIETAPTTASDAAENGPLIVVSEKKPRTPRRTVSLNSSSSGLQDNESRFIRFID